MTNSGRSDPTLALSLDALPKLNKVYSMVTHEESHALLVGEFFSREMNDFLSLKGIIHFSSCPPHPN